MENQEKIEIMNDLFRKLPKIIRKKAIDCRKYSRNCNRCISYKNGMCLWNELKKNTIKNIEVLKNDTKG